MTDPVRDVLLVVADQWRADGLGRLGTPGVVTPNLDGLAARSVTFTNHWCQTSPCGPARSTLLTGTAVETHGQWSNDDPADHGLATLPALVADAGLAPLLIGYTDTPTAAAGDDRAGRGGGRLFDPGFELIRPFFWQLGFPAYRRYLEQRGHGPLSPEMMGIYPPAGPPRLDGGGHLAPSAIPAEDSDVAWLTDAAIDTIVGRPEPMLLHLNWLRPHPPLVPPDPYHRLVDPDEVALPHQPLPLEDQLAAHPYFELAAGGRPMGEYLQERRRIESVDEADQRRIRAAYWGLLAEVDHHLGRVLEALRRTGRDRSTLIVVTGDHGDALGDHWLYGRRGPFDGHFRVPCLIHDPRPRSDSTRGLVVDAVTAAADLLPTILDAVGHPVPPTVEGRSLLGFSSGHPPADWRTDISLAMDWTDQVPRAERSAFGPDRPFRFRVLRTEHHRYVEFDGGPDGGFEPLLYDLVEDPAETVNRAADPTRATVLADLSARLR